VAVTARRGRTAPRWRLADLSLDDRIARGRAARGEAPRSGHARWEPAPGRPDPVTLLADQAATRVPELVPIRYGRMLVSPGTFYRGGALIMASDLAATPRSGITVQLCGDAHLSNFGVFASPERQLIFDINDFDETLPGPFEYDVARMAASFTIAARNNGFSMADAREVTRTSVSAYRSAMAEFAAMNEVYARFFGSHRPARSTVAVGGLPRGVRVEIELIAAR